MVIASQLGDNNDVAIDAGKVINGALSLKVKI